ncbi:hypothetical protein SAV14893_092980 [Streptomyces avermitilis]|uniref:Uncharacterized protein n=1 Tax=Streptomyces avermitilis TaxID=33903 RepID=A0A4D4MDM0_STRAX|nr:hypothetical protein SAVMC3_03430 [Streptomyces avermitilis]GDY69905.1 hypothetical protein SAV14893_092980 [Streptomyces avermitilis]GDY80172.1 hypothetical protein SAV31267_096570 [Streptomyces avermitilis]
MGVHRGGDADVGVSEEFLDHDEVDALFQEQGRGRVAEVVEADASESGSAEGWRVRAVGQGYDHQLAALARAFGVDIVG